MESKTLVIKLAYDGTNYHGWQYQPEVTTVQLMLEKAIIPILKYKPKMVAAGRTDTGVHARGQVVSIPIADEVINRLPDLKIFKKALNVNLPKNIRIHGICILNEAFSARFDGRQRQYKYRVNTDFDVFKRLYAAQSKFPLDFNKMNQAAHSIIGRHNFTTFSKVNHKITNHICNLQVCHWTQIDEGNWVLDIHADRFLYSMVRMLVSAMMAIGRDKKPVEYLYDSLLLQNRALALGLAPACGLTFEHVIFKDSIIFDFV